MIEMSQTVRLVQPVIKGKVIDTRFNKSAGQLEHLIDYEDAQGERQQRWFLESSLEVAQ